MGSETDRIEFSCPRCGGDDVICEATVSKKYNVVFTNDGDIELDLRPDDQAEHEDVELEACWQCAGCYNVIFEGTKEQFIEYLISQKP